MRKEVPLLITFVVALIAMLSQVTTGNVPGLGVAIPDVFERYISPWMTVVSAFSLCLASVNLIVVHSRNVSRKQPEWIYSVVLLGSLVIYGIWCTYIQLNPDDTVASSGYSLIYNYILSPLMTGQWACLAFYVASASYRAFRARNLEATVLLGSAILVMLGATPVGGVIWSKFPVIQRWLIDIPNMTGQRALLIGAAVGSFVACLRTMLGIERGHLGIGGS
jgi:hypothetical protein